MRIPVAFPTPYSRISVEPRANGLALIYEFVPPSSLIPKTTVALIVKWPEVIVIAALALVAGLLLRFRKAISASWFVADWARNNLVAAAIIIAVFSVLVGITLAVWKRRQQFVYGVGEVVVGAFSAFATALFLWPNGELSKFVTLASAVYVVSRGVNNVADAIEREEGIERLKSTVEHTPPSPTEPWPPSIIR